MPRPRPHAAARPTDAARLARRALHDARIAGQPGPSPHEDPKPTAR